MRLLALVFVSLAAACSQPSSIHDAGARGPTPPVAKKQPVTRTAHGETRVDDYGWIKEKTPEVEELLREENDYTAAMLWPLTRRMSSLANEIDQRRPFVVEHFGVTRAGWRWFSRQDGDSAFEQVWRRRVDDPDSDGELVIDPGEFSETFAELLGPEISEDGLRAAFAIDTDGSREYSLRVRDVMTGDDTAPIEHVTSFAFGGDSRTLFFTTENEAKRSSKAFRLDPKAKEPKLIFEETDEHFELVWLQSETRKLLILESTSVTTNELRFIQAKTPRAAFTLVAPRVTGQISSIEERGKDLIIATQDQGAEARIVSVPLANPRGKRTELVPRRAGIPISTFQVFRTHLVVWERVEGELRPRAIDWKTRASTPIAEVDGVLSPHVQEDLDGTAFLFDVESPLQPPSVMQQDLISGAMSELWRLEFEFDVRRFEQLKVFATAKDGTKIPITLVRTKGAAPDAPLLLEGYGAYGTSLEPLFSGPALSLLERGVVLAFAHIRGGGEFGDAWHDAGRLGAKNNTFGDFISCAEFLIAEHHTTKDKLIITGASAGGLLMGAVLNLRPELFHAAFVEVPFVDVINTMLDPTLPLTTNEYEEWGDPREPEQYAWLRAYSPYENVKAQAYPSIFVRGAYNDTLVLFHEPTKWVQKLRAMKTGDAPVLLWMPLDASGHTGGTHIESINEDDARRIAWLLSQWGM